MKEDMVDVVWRRYVDNKTGEVIQLDVVRRVGKKQKMSKLIYYFGGKFNYTKIIKITREVIIARENYSRILFTYYME